MDADLPRSRYQKEMSGDCSLSPLLALTRKLRTLRFWPNAPALAGITNRLHCAESGVAHEASTETRPALPDVFPPRLPEARKICGFFTFWSVGIQATKTPSFTRRDSPGAQGRSRLRAEVRNKIDEEDRGNVAPLERSHSPGRKEFVPNDSWRWLKPRSRNGPIPAGVGEILGGASLQKVLENFDFGCATSAAVFTSINYRNGRKKMEVAHGMKLLPRAQPLELIFLSRTIVRPAGPATWADTRPTLGRPRLPAPDPALANTSRGCNPGKSFIRSSRNRWIFNSLAAP